MNKQSSFIVLKFGGTSVSKADNWRVIAAAVGKRLKEGLRPVVVCSAFSGVSDMLEKLMERACRGSDYEEILAKIKAMHTGLESDLGLTGENGRTGKSWTDDFEELSRLTLGLSLTGEAGPGLRARIMAYGELMLTRLGAAFLEKTGLTPTWLDARKLLTSKRELRAGEVQQYMHAVCCHEKNPKLIAYLEELGSGPVLTQGFIASNEGGETVLLGRGGSDTSAAYLASALGAVSCEIWTDVPGIFTANPYQVPEARLIQELSYEEAQEIAASGAGVLHPRCIPPLRDAGILLHLRSTHTPEIAGTVIGSARCDGSPHIKCISSKTGVLLVSMDAIDMWHQAGFLADAFSEFKRAGLSIDLVSTSETNVTVSLDANIQALDPKTINALTSELGEMCRVRTIGPCAIINLVGRSIRTIMHELGPTMKVFEEKRIHLISQASNDLNFSFVVDEEEAPRLVKKLHGLLLEEGGRGEMFGPSWRELFDRHKTVKQSQVQPWWKNREAELTTAADGRTPLFVYDMETLRSRIRDLKSLESVDRVFYAVKANWHPRIILEMDRVGFGFECVSIGELQHLQEVLPHPDPDRILFTPNFAPRREYEHAFELGVHVTLDNLYPLIAWPEVFAGKRILARLDPGKGRGHHKHVHTAGTHSKFGIPPGDFEELAQRSRNNNTQIVGLHAHTGSGILKPGNWSENGLFFTRVKELFPEVRTFDLGGGLGVVEKPGQTPLAISEVQENLAALKKAYPNYSLWLEPGRFLVAESGVLLARVTQVKGKGRTRYVGIDAGMNTLIRPALYGAYHEIINLSKPDRPRDTQANVVGFICESGDTFGHCRLLADPEEGDILLIATAGAYGRSMSSNYNLRPPAEELFLS